MQINPNFMLKFIYKTMSFSLPGIINNPLANNKLYVPIDIKPHSTYINFKMNDNQVNTLSNYVKQYNKSLSLVPIQLYENSQANYYLSINIYNSTSPVFMTDDNIVRCELNTYVMDHHGTKGTLILDYITDGISMDPVSIFKQHDNLKEVIFERYENERDVFNIVCKSPMEDIYLFLNYTTSNVYPKKLSHDLLEYTDNIFYKNGILDKVYHDNSLLNPVLFGVNIDHVNFFYKNMVFDNLDSIFYFKDNLYFIGSMWDNL